MGSGERAHAAVSARRVRKPDPGTGGAGRSRPGQPAPPPAVPGPPLLRGRVRLALIRDLAMGEWSYAEIGRQIGATTHEIAEFAKAEADAINEVKAALAGKLAVESAGLWISKKQNRVAELEAMYADGVAVLNHLRSLPITDGQGLGSRRHGTTARTQLAILGAVAAEYEPRRGSPTAQGTDANVVHYIIEGLDTESLT